MGLRNGSDLKGYEVRFVTTMLAHQTKLLVVLVAVNSKRRARLIRYVDVEASDRVTSFLARRGFAACSVLEEAGDRVEGAVTFRELAVVGLEVFRRGALGLAVSCEGTALAVVAFFAAASLASRFFRL